MRWIIIAVAVLAISTACETEPTYTPNPPTRMTATPDATTCPSVEERAYLGRLGSATTEIGAVLTRIAGALDSPVLAEVYVRELEVYIAELELLRGPNSVAVIDLHAKNTARYLREFIAAYQGDRIAAAERALLDAEQEMLRVLPLVTGFCETRDSGGASETAPARPARPTSTPTAAPVRARPTVVPTATPSPTAPAPTAPPTAQPAPTATPTPARTTPTATPAPTTHTAAPTATPTAPPRVAPRIDVVITTSRAASPSVEVHVTPDHRIVPFGLQMFVQIDGTWHGSTHPSVIEAGERYVFGGVRDGTWQDVTGVTAKSLDGATLREWRCENVTTRHDVDGRYACEATTTLDLPSLRDVAEPVLWVYVTNERDTFDVNHIRVDARAGGDDLERVFVRVRYGGDFADIGVTDGSIRSLPADMVARAGGGYSRWNGYPPVPHHSDVVAVHARAGVPTGIQMLMRCEQHADSTAERSIYACEPW